MKPRRLSRPLRGLRTYLSQRLTPTGWALLVVGFVALAHGSISLRLPTYHIGSFAAVTLSLAGFIAFVSPPKVWLTRRHLKPATAGTSFQYEIEVHNQSRRCLYHLSATEWQLPTGMVLADSTETRILPRLGPYEVARLPLRLNCPKRGIYYLNGLYASSAFPLGICRSLRLFHQEDRLVVYPVTRLPPEFTTTVLARLTLGHRLVHRQPGESTDFRHVREYTAGDNPRHIHWASWARTGTPTVKKYEDEETERVVFVLDTTLSSPQDADDFETAVSILAGIGIHLAQQGIIVDQLLTGDPTSALPDHRRHGNSPQARITPLLEQLAGVSTQEETNWVDIATRIISPTWHRQRVILIALDWSTAIAHFVHYLQTHHCSIQTLVVRRSPPSHPLPTPSSFVSHYHPTHEEMV